MELLRRVIASISSFIPANLPYSPFVGAFIGAAIYALIRYIRHLPKSTSASHSKTRGAGHHSMEGNMEQV